MADYRVTDTQLSSIANAIRTKGGTSASLVFPSGFVSAVENIPTGGGVLISKTISQNGSYRAADDNADGYSDVVVNVSGGSSPVLVSKSISQNGTYNPSDDNADAYSQVVVDVPSGGGSVDNYLIAAGAVSGIINDSYATIIGRSAFVGRTNISGIIEQNVLTIGSNAFLNSTLSMASFPECTTIGEYAFFSCDFLNTISFPKCTNIGVSAFAVCNFGTADFPECINIGINAFYSCFYLTTLNFPKCTNINIGAFNYCRNLTAASFSKCTNIGASAFSYCSKLSVADFPECTTIGTSAFVNCPLTTVSFPKCTNIGASAFADCQSLTTVSFPECTNIGGNAFKNCKSLSKLYLLSPSVATLGNANAFQSTPMSLSSYIGDFGSIYVPASLVESYKSAANWSVYSDRITSYVEE